MSKSILVLVTLILALCAGGGFALGLMSTASRRVATEDAAPVAGNIAVSGAIPDAQPLAPPPPPPPPKPKAAAIEPAASDLPPAATAPPAESAPAAPPAPSPPKPPAPLPADLPPT